MEDLGCNPEPMSWEERKWLYLILLKQNNLCKTPGTFKWRKEQERQCLCAAERGQVAALTKTSTFEGLPAEWRHLPEGTEVKIMETTTLKVTRIWLAGQKPSAMGHSSPPIGCAKGWLPVEGASWNFRNVRPSKKRVSPYLKIVVRVYVRWQRYLTLDDSMDK